MSRIEAGRFRELFLKPTRWIDVRAPVEFREGAVPEALNIPLLEDSERHEVGILYKEKGQSAAIELGHQLVSGQVKEQRMHLWREAADHPDAVIYCFRGGLRSQTVQSWLRDSQMDVPIVAGGYKALRRFLLSTMETETARLPFEVVSGPTGSGKTDYLKSTGEPYLDLEKLARHRGSAFGAFEGEPQPSQADFENALAVELIRLRESKRPILIENESRMIGRLALPSAVYQKIQDSPKRLLAVSLEDRVENIFKDYILESRLGRAGDAQKFSEFENAVRSISRRLGGLRAQEILGDLQVSRSEFAAAGDLSSNRLWIRKLLTYYYDPLYSRSL